jgi:hypothetical protein
MRALASNTFAAAIAALVTLAQLAARADVPSPPPANAGPCRDKSAGDACQTVEGGPGTCTTVKLSRSRLGGTYDALVCTAGAAPTPTPTPTTAPSPSPSPTPIVPIPAPTLSASASAATTTTAAPSSSAPKSDTSTAPTPPKGGCGACAMRASSSSDAWSGLAALALVGAIAARRRR